MSSICSASYLVGSSWIVYGVAVIVGRGERKAAAGCGGSERARGARLALFLATTRLSDAQAVEPSEVHLSPLAPLRSLSLLVLAAVRLKCPSCLHFFATD